MCLTTSLLSAIRRTGGLPWAFHFSATVSIARPPPLGALPSLFGKFSAFALCDPLRFLLRKQLNYSYFPWLRLPSDVGFQSTERCYTMNPLPGMGCNPTVSGSKKMPARVHRRPKGEESASFVVAALSAAFCVLSSFCFVRRRQSGLGSGRLQMLALPCWSSGDLGALLRSCRPALALKESILSAGSMLD
jgi:hypothetical protein